MMRGNAKRYVATGCVAIAILGLEAASGALGAQTACVDYSKDPAGCQPSTFRTPLAEIPVGRINRDGKPDKLASEGDVKAGAAKLQKDLRLVRNFEYLHWVPAVPSAKDPATGGWAGGDLDGEGGGRGFALSGNCIFLGNSNGPGRKHPISIFRIQRNAEQQAPVRVGEIAALVGGNAGYDDKEFRALQYTTSGGEDRMILVRMAGVHWTVASQDGAASPVRLEIRTINPDTCLPIALETQASLNGGHEYFLWHDPVNRNRILIFVANASEGGAPDPKDPSIRIPDIVVYSITDEATGKVLAMPRVLAGFRLEDVGGPPSNEKPDETGLFSDGRFVDFSHLTTRANEAAGSTAIQRNLAHSLSVSDDGERVYVANTSAGFYVLNSETIAHRRDVDLAAGKAGCHPRSTIVAIRGAIDAAKLPALANDCLHMVVNDDPGLKALLASNASASAKAQRYLVLLTRSRFDPFPPYTMNATGTHSAVLIPNRPSQVRGNSKGRPAYVWLTDENLGCPAKNARLVSIEVETTPVLVSSTAVPDVQLDKCLEQSRVINQTSHNPTVFTNLVFTAWQAHGLRVTDISLPEMPREVGYALTIPNTSNRGYPILKDGLFYWSDTTTGLHVAKYTGPRSDELPKSGAYNSQQTSPYR